MNEESRKFLDSIYFPLLFLSIIWAVKLSEIIFNFSLTEYGLLPREIKGLIGIVTTPLIHADINHLVSNTIPILSLGTGIFYFYKDTAKKVVLILYFVPGVLVWFIGRDAYHIGASGIIYGLVTFIFFSGVIRRDVRSIALSLIVTFLYGSLVWGVLPIDSQVSWESHLAGAVIGFICAFIFKKSDPYKKYDWEDEPDTEKPDELEISYDKEYPFD